jgi:hypothetical protein
MANGVWPAITKLVDLRAFWSKAVTNQTVATSFPLAENRQVENLPPRVTTFVMY